MKLENVKIDHLDLSYEVPLPGTSVLQFEEGIAKQFNEKSGKTTLRLPLIIDKVVEGPPENEGKKMSHFIPIETAFGEKQLVSILSMTGLLESLSKKYLDDFSPMENEEFIKNLKLKLPGKFIKAVHDVRKDSKGKDQVNIVRFEAFTNSGTEKPSLKKVVDKTPAAVSEDGW